MGVVTSVDCVRPLPSAPTTFDPQHQMTPASATPHWALNPMAVAVTVSPAAAGTG